MRSASGSSWPQDGKKKRHKDATRNPTHVADFIGITGENRNEPGGIRTPDLLVRSQTLYPAELQARGLHYYARMTAVLKGPDLEHRGSVYPAGLEKRQHLVGFFQRERLRRCPHGDLRRDAQELLSIPSGGVSDAAH